MPCPAAAHQTTHPSDQRRPPRSATLHPRTLPGPSAPARPLRPLRAASRRAAAAAPAPPAAPAGSQFFGVACSKLAANFTTRTGDRPSALVLRNYKGVPSAAKDWWHKFWGAIVMCSPDMQGRMGAAYLDAATNKPLDAPLPAGVALNVPYYDTLGWRRKMTPPLLRSSPAGRLQLAATAVKCGCAAQIRVTAPTPVFSLVLTRYPNISEAAATQRLYECNPAMKVADGIVDKNQTLTGICFDPSPSARAPSTRCSPPTRSTRSQARRVP